MKIGLAGIGRMGRGIAARILEHGFELAIWNRSPVSAEPLLALGAVRAHSLSELARQSDVLLTCLTGDEAILDAVHRRDGVLAGLRPGAIHLCLMTISPQCSDALDAIHRSHGSAYLAGPVSGRPDAAAAGALLTYLAGPAAAIERVRPVASAYASRIVVVGERPRLANCLKLSINLTLCSIMHVLGEAYAFAEKCGIDPELLNDWYQTAFAHPAIRTYANKIRARDFDRDVGYSMTGGLKDVQLMLATAADAGMTLGTAALVERSTRRAIEAGLALSDWTGFTEVIRAEAGLPSRIDSSAEPH